jgi:hypothetical protein
MPSRFTVQGVRQGESTKDELETEYTMTTVRFPEMRLDVVSAIEFLSDPERQKLSGKIEEGVYYADLTLYVNILYDDCQVLPDPSLRVGSILYPSEGEVLRTVHEVLNPLLDDLGNKPDSDYFADPQWSSVVVAARETLRTMLENERLFHSGVQI